jgi:hypothetical protein
MDPIIIAPPSFPGAPEPNLDLRYLYRRCAYMVCSVSTDLRQETVGSEVNRKMEISRVTMISKSCLQETRTILMTSLFLVRKLSLYLSVGLTTSFSHPVTLSVRSLCLKSTFLSPDQLEPK